MNLNVYEIGVKNYFSYDYDETTFSLDVENKTLLRVPFNRIFAISHTRVSHVRFTINLYNNVRVSSTRAKPLSAGISVSHVPTCGLVVDGCCNQFSKKDRQQSKL